MTKNKILCVIAWENLIKSCTGRDLVSFVTDDFFDHVCDALS